MRTALEGGEGGEGGERGELDAEGGVRVRVRVKRGVGGAKVNS